MESDAVYEIDGANRASVSVRDDDAPAQNVLWTADMTVTDFGGGSVGAIAEDSFLNARGSDQFRVKWLWYQRGERSVHLALWRGLHDVEGATLHLGDMELAFPDRSGDASFQ